ncbi:glycosyl hydrolase family 18 protein [Streptomyces sp. NBC_00536]|uniref:glycosyl hydrolase family 18 protein n=1 Tax=Streptomyces sp. NBC_00536 TaxID=2975769 RepID=UPI002E80B800|nr:glycosyl hydrolase family 18 protein [Streptomyces sp. NBC_00536]WUC82760.1 glycosyl hydrolase family 18 protein [Streptomyces sp. NBC_00536]
MTTTPSPDSSPSCPVLPSLPVSLRCAAALAAVLLTTASAPAGRTGPGAAPADAARARTRTSSAWLPYWDTEAGYASALAHADQLHTVSPFWYTASAADTVTGEAGAGDRRIIDGLHGKGIKVVPTVTETPGPAAMAGLLGDPDERATHVDALMDVVTSRSYDGLDLDYERMAETTDPALTGKVRDGYNRLTEELCARLHAVGKTCVVTVMPRVDGDGLAFDYAHLGKVADTLRIMGYNLHDALGEPGPLSSLDWYDRFVGYAVGVVPRAKLEVALPAYGWNWTVGSGARAGHVTSREAEALRVRVGAARAFDPVSGTPHFDYTDDDGEEHEVWYQDARGSAAHLAVLDRHGVRGTGLWALGFEDPQLWAALER